MEKESIYKAMDNLSITRGDMTGRSYDDPMVAEAREEVNQAFQMLSDFELKEKISGSDIKSVTRMIDKAKRDLQKVLDKFEGDDIQIEDWIAELDDAISIIEDQS